jgi:hypothetical protein
MDGYDRDQFGGLVGAVLGVLVFLQFLGITSV